MSVSEVLETVRAMSPEERASALLDALPNGSSLTEDAVQARLHEAGLLGEMQPRDSRRTRARHTPVEIKGKPLSQTIIDERGLAPTGWLPISSIAARSPSAT